MDSMRWDKTGKMGSGPTSKYQHSSSFLEDDIIRDAIELFMGKIQYEVAIDASWGKTHW